MAGISVALKANSLCGSPFALEQLPAYPSQLMVKKPNLKYFFRDYLSLLQEQRESCLEKELVYAVESDGYIFHKIFMILV